MHVKTNDSEAEEDGWKKSDFCPFRSFFLLQRNAPEKDARKTWQQRGFSDIFLDWLVPHFAKLKTLVRQVKN